MTQNEGICILYIWNTRQTAISYLCCFTTVISHLWF